MEVRSFSWKEQCGSLKEGSRFLSDAGPGKAQNGEGGQTPFRHTWPVFTTLCNKKQKNWAGLGDLYKERRCMFFVSVIYLILDER